MLGHVSSNKTKRSMKIWKLCGKHIRGGFVTYISGLPCWENRIHLGSAVTCIFKMLI